MSLATILVLGIALVLLGLTIILMQVQYRELRREQDEINRLEAVIQARQENRDRN